MAFRVQILGISSIWHPKTGEAWEERELVDIRLAIGFEAETTGKAIRLSHILHHD
jgi:hypothetical protein